MGMGSHQGLSLSIFYPQCLPLEPLGWSVGRDVALKQAELWVLVAAGWGDEFHVADGSLSGLMVDGPVDLAKVICLEDALPRSWYGFQTNLSAWPIVPLSFECRARILPGCSLWHWFEFPIDLSYFLTFGNKFGIKYFTWCLVWCMHAWYKNMKWHIMLKNIWPTLT